MKKKKTTLKGFPIGKLTFKVKNIFIYDKIYNLSNGFVCRIPIPTSIAILKKFL